MLQKPIMRWLSGVVLLFGVILFGKLVVHAVDGSLATHYFEADDVGRSPWRYFVYSLVLGVAIPFHVVSVGLFLHRPWLKRDLRGLVRFCVVASGCWLGGALAVRLFLLGG